MNNKLTGAIFILFGMGLLGDSTADVYHNSISTDYGSLKSVIGIVLGISSCMYGYKRMKSGNSISAKGK